MGQNVSPNGVIRGAFIDGDGRGLMFKGSGEAMPPFPWLLKQGATDRLQGSAVRNDYDRPSRHDQVLRLELAESPRDCFAARSDAFDLSPKLVRGESFLIFQDHADVFDVNQSDERHIRTNISRCNLSMILTDAQSPWLAGGFTVFRRTDRRLS